MIDEKKLIEEMNKYARENFHLSDEFEWVLEGMIKALDIVERQPKVGEWIPCSKEMPPENVPVLTCDKTGWISVNINIHYAVKKNDFDCGYYVAWMPLPEPYRKDVE